MKDMIKAIILTILFLAVFAGFKTKRKENSTTK